MNMNPFFFFRCDNSAKNRATRASICNLSRAGARQGEQDREPRPETNQSIQFIPHSYLQYSALFGMSIPFYHFHRTNTFDHSR